MRTHSNEHWEFDDNGLMRIRDMSANDYPIEKTAYQPAVSKEQIYMNIKIVNY
jgi:nuclear transport factor 2 (NTF2) superfamily protein